MDFLERLDLLRLLLTRGRIAGNFNHAIGIRFIRNPLPCLRSYRTGQKLSFNISLGCTAINWLNEIWGCDLR